MSKAEWAVNRQLVCHSGDSSSVKCQGDAVLILWGFFTQNRGMSTSEKFIWPKNSHLKQDLTGWSWHMPLIPALGGRDSQIFVNSRPAWSAELGQAELHKEICLKVGKKD